MISEKNFMDNQLTAELQARLAELQEIFHQQLPGKIDELQSAWRALSAQWTPDHLSQLHRLCHSLAGSAGTFGAHEVSQQARMLEQRLKQIASETDDPASATQPPLAQQIEMLTQSAEQWKPPLQVARDVVEQTISDNSQNDLIYLVEDDPQIAQQITQRLSRLNYQVRHFTTPDAFVTACRGQLPSMILMDMAFAESNSAGAEILKKLQQPLQHCPNTIFISARNDIEARLAALRAGAQHYLTKPVDLAKLERYVDRLSGRRDAQPYRVLLVDDDDTLAQYHSEILESHGIETHIINNPMMTLEAIEAYRPELILLDIYMDQCSGTELAAIIRQDDSLALMPIVFLSEELDRDYQIASLHLGGDDFLTKPVNPNYLIEMVSARLARARNIRQRE